jgi:hypothetical protein
MPGSNTMSQQDSNTPPDSFRVREHSLLKDRYELRELIEEGGMGRVYRAFDRVLHRPLAVKVLSQDLDSAAAIQRFEQEARILSQLHHPNLVAVFDFGVEGVDPFMVLELLDGKMLCDFLEAHPELELERALDLIHQVGEGLAAAHERGVIHRDVKPNNVLICENGGRDRAVLIDFGLALQQPQPALAQSHSKAQARLTSAGFILGTQRYMAPEILEGHPCTVSTDVFAFGLVCAEILAGTDAVAAGRLREEVVLGEREAAPYLPVLAKACHTEPSRRWPTVRSMLREFKAIDSAGIVGDSPVRHGLWGVFSRNWFAMTISVFVLALAGSLAWLWQSVSQSITHVPDVRIEEVALAWKGKSSADLQIQVQGEVVRSRPQRLLVEVAICDLQGNRISSSQSILVDGALGGLKTLDVTKVPTRIDKTFLVPVPKSQEEGYASVTIFDSQNRIADQQNSAFWPARSAQPSG